MARLVRTFATLSRTPEFTSRKVKNRLYKVN